MPLSVSQKDSVLDLQESQNLTKRPVSQELEKILYEPIGVLDHGFIRVVDYMGDDDAIVQAARVSYGKGTKKVSQDRGLIHYLMRHRHTTPFEMCEIKFHIKLPIFIARQWIRHRTANVNEYSARYSVLENEFYVPKKENLATQSASNKQGRGDGLTPQNAEEVLEILKNDAQNAFSHYQDLLNEDEDGHVRDEERQGLARELARMNLSLNFYTQWYWKIDLHNLLHFLSLRADSHAQYEIRAYAHAMLDIVKKWVPHTYEAFEKYVMQGAKFSADGVDTLKKMIKGQKVMQKESGMNPREWREFCQLLSLNPETGNDVTD